MWYDERVCKSRDTSNPEFSMCCMQGRIEIAPLKRLPQELYDLYHNNDRRSRYFLENIRSFNSMFAFTSMGGRIDKTKNDGKAPPVFVLNGENYHQIGSLIPREGQQPKFAQLYIYDTDNELKNRMAAVRYFIKPMSYQVETCYVNVNFTFKIYNSFYVFLVWKMTKIP